MDEHRDKGWKDHSAGVSQVGGGGPGITGIFRERFSEVHFPKGTIGEMQGQVVTCRWKRCHILLYFDQELFSKSLFHDKKNFLPPLSDPHFNPVFPGIAFSEFQGLSDKSH